MDEKDLVAINKFLQIAEKIHHILIQEGLLPATSTVSEMCNILNETAAKLGYTIGFPSLIVFIDYLYSMGGYRPFSKPHVTVEWLVTEANEIYTYAKTQAKKELSTDAYSCKYITSSSTV